MTDELDLPLPAESAPAADPVENVASSAEIADSSAEVTVVQEAATSEAVANTTAEMRVVDLSQDYSAVVFDADLED
ncbi:MAG TPA: hypothetical protein VF517_15000 [Thermoleophilaceae bacterium]|jgi:hypothetical protein